MNSENDDQCSLASPIESKHESQKQSKILYTRDFLLSLSELDICKKLPSGFDPSVLSEFEDGPLNVPERQRILGGLHSQNFRRGEYGSSPPTRVEILGNYSRGSNGRWDAGSSGSSDKDGELQSDRVSIGQDSGKRFGNQSRRPWQNPEHDGLLGSGAFPRPSGYTGGASAANTRGNGQYLLNKSTEPYQPPRTYKAVPHSRRGTTDFCNDETFGSVECASQDREEEERKRRASFELMRKEQQRTLQEKQKQISNNRKEKIDTDTAILLENTDEEQSLWNNNSRPEDCMTTSVSQNVHGNCSLPTQAPPSRPLVPPGFKSTILEKNLGTQSIISTSATEAGNVGFDNNVAHTKGIIMTNGVENYHEKVKQTTAYMHSNNQQYETESAGIPVMDANEKLVIPSSGVDVSDCSIGLESPSYKTYGLQKASEGCADSVVTDFDTEKVTAHEISGSQDNPASILEKLFGNALTLNDSSSPKFSEHHGVKADVDTWIDVSSQSSKFAHWFQEEAEKKPMDNLPSSEARDLLSLIVSSEKGGFQVSTASDERSIEQIPTFPFTSNEISQKLITSASSSVMVGVPDPLYHCAKPDMSLGVLTCEDLEQVIMSEVHGSSSILQHSVQEPWSDLHTKTEQQKMDVDNSASQHLLFLLQKGTNLKEKTSSPNIDIGSSDKPGLSEIQSISGRGESIDNSEKTLTLETLFGMAFMKELQTSKAPVSVKRSSVNGINRTDVLEPQGLPFSGADDGFFLSTVNEYGSSKTSHDVSSMTLNHTQELKSVKNEGHWLSSVDPQTEGSISGTVVGLRDGTDRGGEIQLPEEESLITVGDPLRIETSIFRPVGNTTKSEELVSSMRPVEIVDKLAALNAILKDERSMEPGLDSPHLFRGSYNPVESELLYHHLHRQQSSPQFLPHQMNRPRPLDHHAHMAHQINFMGPENIPHDPHRHPFPGNTFHHPFHNPGARLDHPAHHSMLQQMPMPGSFPPPQLLQGLPRNIQAPHFINHMASYRPELKPMQGFPLNNLQRNYGGIGVEMPGSGGSNGGNHPEALQRLIEMELRANSKQMPPVAAVHNPGMIYGPEHDTVFRYR